MIVANEDSIGYGRLGKAPARSHLNALMFSNYAEPIPVLPTATNFWTDKPEFPKQSFGNIDYSDCTRASQAIAALRMESLETGQIPSITDEEIERVYFEMTKKYYGGGDTGASEMDALNEWRRPDCTFKDTEGNPLAIDAYLRINQANIQEVKQAMVTAKAHGIKICMNLPIAFSGTLTWDIPIGQQPIGRYQPGSWGGHSMFTIDYNEFGLIVPTWDTVAYISWNAVANYADEAYVIIDSIDSWITQVTKKELNLDAIKSDVNQSSSQKIK
jgi:hypothetical protein